MAVLLLRYLKHFSARRPCLLRSIQCTHPISQRQWMFSILEGKASRNARIAFGAENRVKPCSLETIKQIFTRSKKKKITLAQTPREVSNPAGSFRMNIFSLREFSLDMNIILY
jgi:hypothetical protein